jgi:hypothetical protein
MANGVYGTSIPVNIADNDIANQVDIYYAYSATKNSDNVTDTSFQKLDASYLKNVNYTKTDTDIDNVLEGLYNLKLPVAIFGKKGFYTIFIKPKEIPAVIADISTLTAYPSVRGIILDTKKLDSSIQSIAQKNNGLVGYRIIYIDDNGERDNSNYKLITSNNRCEPVISAPNSSSDKAYTYRYNENSSLIFVTVTPSSALSFKADSAPYIGKSTQNILLVNTAFEPIMIELEMVDHDADTISYMLENSQLRDLDHGLVTTYNENNEIYNQAEHFTLKDTQTGNPTYEVKNNKQNNIDFTQTLEDKL